MNRSLDPAVVLQLPDGSSATLTHGDLIGRLESAALHLGDPRISEAHAMVSLRGGTLKLVALRGRIAVDGFALRDVELVPGLVVHLAADFALSVERVLLPDHVLGLEVGGGGVRMVTGVCSLVGAPEPALRSGYVPDARAWFWPEGAQLAVRRPGLPDDVLVPGVAIDIDGTPVAARRLEVAHGGGHATADHDHAPAAQPIEIVGKLTSVHISRPGSRTLVIAGLAARIMSDLVAAGVPMPWAVLAREIWPHELSEPELRAKWDVTLTRLRKKLIAAGLRPDLVRSDGHGNLELCLAHGDTTRDES